MDPYLGQISLVSFAFAPKGWALCNGQKLPISQNQALYSLLSNTFGGDGKTTFGLPDLQGRVPVGVGQGFPLGSPGGSETVALTIAQIPSHLHTLTVSNAPNGSLPTPQGNTVGASSSSNQAFASSANALMDAAAISYTGSGQGHENRSPFLVLNWIIALTGIYPSRN